MYYFLFIRYQAIFKCWRGESREKCSHSSR